MSQYAGLPKRFYMKFENPAAKYPNQWKMDLFAHLLHISMAGYILLWMEVDSGRQGKVS